MDQRLEPFLLLVKNAKGKAAADLIQRVTAEPGIYAFSELLPTPGIVELQHGPEKAAYNLLQLFCYGTWADYRGSTDIQPLSPAQTVKLKQLTVMALTTSSQRVMYSELMSQLEIDNIRDLEDFLISECFHCDLISGKLDQKQRCLFATRATARDVRPDQIQSILTSLTNWSKQCEQTKHALQKGMSTVTALSNEAEEKKTQEDAVRTKAKSKFDGSEVGSRLVMPPQLSTGSFGNGESSSFVDVEKKGQMGLSGYKRRR